MAVYDVFHRSDVCGGFICEITMARLSFRNIISTREQHRNLAKNIYGWMTKSWIRDASFAYRKMKFNIAFVNISLPSKLICLPFSVNGVFKENKFPVSEIADSFGELAKLERRAAVWYLLSREEGRRRENVSTVPLSLRSKLGSRFAAVNVGDRRKSMTLL